MGSITSLNARRDQQLKEEKKEKERRKARPGLIKKTIKGTIYCSFCGSIAYYFAVRKSDAKKIPLCQTCAPSTNQNALWILSIEQIKVF